MGWEIGQRKHAREHRTPQVDVEERELVLS